MGNKYQEALGNWEHKIGSITHIIKANEDDNFIFLRAKDEAEKTQNQTLLFERIGKLYFDMVFRDDKDMSEEEKKDLKTWISVNIAQICEDFLIAFHWSTPEKLAEIKKKVKSV